MLPTKQPPPAVTGLQEGQGEVATQEACLHSTVLVFGDSGTGKNTCIATLLKHGQKVRLLAADPNAEIGIRNGLTHHKLTPEQMDNFAAVNLTLGHLGDGRKTVSKLREITKQTTQLSAKQIEAQPADTKKADKIQLLRVADALDQFTTASGKSLGHVDDWGNDTWLVVDGLTTLSRAAQNSVVGDQLTMSQSNFQAVQNLIKLYILTFTNLRCNHILLAHADQIKDELSGSVKIFPTSLGGSISNWMPGNYGDVIYSYRDGDKFLWSNRHTRAVGRSTLLPPGNAHEQDFLPIIKKLAALGNPLF